MKVNKFFDRYKKYVISTALGILFTFLFVPVSFKAQTPKETPPPPGEPNSVNIPAVQESKLKNGLPVVVVERTNVPLVTVRLLIKSGASKESSQLAGVADMTAELLTKGTKNRTATQIAEEIEFLGGSISSGSNWNSTQITIDVTSDKLDKALAIMSDAVLNPTFKQEEIDLYKKQVLDNLSVSLKQPGVLANYVASRYSFSEHNSTGTPESIGQISKSDIESFYKKFYVIPQSILIFTGDISQKDAMALSAKYFGKWANKSKKQTKDEVLTVLGKVNRDSREINENKETEKVPIVFERILVVNLPNSGQASVNYVKKLDSGRVNCFGVNDEPVTCRSGYIYDSASVLNSILGGGYSSRLNQEIRIKRGLSYGAGSNFDWRNFKSNFTASTQTKNESAGEVAELINLELAKLSNENISDDELGPRKAVLTGSFGRSLETNGGLANRITELYLYGLKTDELNKYMDSIRNVKQDEIKEFADQNLTGGDLIIVGDASIFMDDLTKRFGETPIDVISIDDLDLNSENLRKPSDNSSVEQKDVPKSIGKPKNKKNAPKGIKPKGKSDADRTDN